MYAGITAVGTDLVLSSSYIRLYSIDGVSQGSPLISITHNTYSASSRVLASDMTSGAPGFEWLYGLYSLDMPCAPQQEASSYVLFLIQLRHSGSLV